MSVKSNANDSDDRSEFLFDFRTVGGILGEPVVHKLAFMDIVNRLRTRYIAKTIASTIIFCSKYCGLSFVLYVEICIFLEVATDA